MCHVNEINSFILHGTECLNVTQFCVGNSFIYYCLEASFLLLTFLPLANN